MSVRVLRAVVARLDGDEATLEFEDGSRRLIAVPPQIAVAEGMEVRYVDTGDEKPVIAWGA